MLALLVSEAAHRGLPATVLTFEPNPRDYFAALAGKPETAPARIATLRDKLCELERCGVAQAVVMRFDAAFAAQTPEAFVADVLVAGLGTRYVLVGDDFRYGARRAGDYAMLDAAGARHGFDVARMMSYEVHGLRVSSSAVRAALAAGDMSEAAALLGRPYSISGRVVHGARLGRSLGESSAGRGDGFRTLNVRFGHPKPAAMGIFVVRVHGLRRRPAGGCRQPRQAADRRRQRPRPARDPLLRVARQRSAPRGATVNSCAWSCCTNCATRHATTRSPSSPRRSAATRPTRAPSSPPRRRRTPRPAGKPPATEFDRAPVAARCDTRRDRSPSGRRLPRSSRRLTAPAARKIHHG